MSIRASGTVITRCSDGILGQHYTRAPLWHFKESTPATAPGPEIRKLLAILDKHETRLDGLHALSGAILDRVTYHLGDTHSHTTAEDALIGGAGVCQDHAQIFIAAARLGGRGKKMTPTPVHAWAEAHVDGLGWVGFDISNGYSPDERYVRIAIGRDARDAAPIEGMRLGSEMEKLNVTLQVQQ